MVVDAYDYTDQLIDQITKEGKVTEISKEFNKIKDNAEKVKFLEKLLLDRNLIPNQENGMRIKKCNDLAKQYRDEGNKHYRNRHYFEALESYNQSLCFAEENSENVGLAYANRSAVYHQMKLYTCSLSNIEKALKHNYPAKSIDKLTKREESCKSMLGDELSNVPAGINHLKMTHKPNKSLPFIADCLKLKSDEKFGRYIVTDIDLSAGDIIACEEPFSKYLLPSNKYRYCANCLSDNFFDLHPCFGCTSAMFCSEKCLKNGFEKFHQYECPIVDRLNEICTKIMRISSQTFFEALAAFDFDVNRLMTACEEHKNVTIYDFDESSLNKENHFMTIDSLVTNESLRNAADFFQRCGIVAVLTHLFLNHTKLSNFLNTDRAKDFYRQFIVKQTQIAAQNYHGIFDGVFSSKPTFTDSNQFGSGSFSFCSLINHSCAPNVVRISYDCKVYVMVNRPIAAGEQLFDNYGYHHCLETIEKRQKRLSEQYMFKCMCEACKRHYPLFPDLKDATNSFDSYISDDIVKLQDLNLETAEMKFADYCKMINKLDKFYPCREVSGLQECILQCSFVFKMSPYKLKLMK